MGKSGEAEGGDQAEGANALSHHELATGEALLSPIR
jgi:hypothetical protein